MLTDPHTFGGASLLSHYVVVPHKLVINYSSCCVVLYNKADVNGSTRVLILELCADELVVGGGGVGGVRPDERALKQRTRWTGVFFWCYRGQPLYLSSTLGGWLRRVNCEYACGAQFHSRNEWIVHCLISGGSYKCTVECWEDADSAGVENAALENAALENVGIKIWQASNG